MSTTNKILERPMPPTHAQPCTAQSAVVQTRLVGKTSGQFYPG